MCVKIFGGIFIILIVFNIVTPIRVNDDQNEEEPRISRHHSRSKSATKDNKIANNKNNDDLETRTIQSQQSIEIVGDDLNREDLNSAEDFKSIKLEDDVSRTGFSDGTNTEINLFHGIDNYDEDDSENSRSENEFTDYQEQINDDTDNIGHLPVTPSYSDLHRDIMLDVRARSGDPKSKEDRSGYVPPEEKIPNIREHNIYPGLRTHLIPEDYVDNIFRPFEYRTDYFSQPRTNFNYNNDMMPPYYSPNNKRLSYKDLLRPYLRYNNQPVYYNRISSREVVYPKPNSQESNWAQMSHHVNIPPRNYGNIPYVSSESCLTCQKQSTSHEHTRRSVEIPYYTANGRRLESEPLGSNTYPYSGGEGISDSPQIPGRSEDALHEDHASKAGYILSDISNKNQETVPKIIIQKSSPIVMNRRVGLAGYHIISGY